ncbi:hypothetical protein NBRC10512_004525 [Rhodotorula toruloides]|uniref:RHTO0S14e03906g1_1 n=2 Tax=Rhodotorula toruloides TaxID=5286 RepID=A0A061BDK1_RHOTO|nr:uncharacterized protein RHTO_05058 [Rhodotorula toruloides NP11]EMS24878.1 hypothetical protein RHTO_05058 [Rhodotorula toruloides NP11]CDR47458.1 RHTO0S14e03906g1_1 [Rhodotorula toruloides]
MLARLFGWTSRPAPEPELASAPSTPRSASPPHPTAEPASPTAAAPSEEARLSRNRKKRQQRKAAKARRRSTLGGVDGHHSDEADSEDGKEPDEDLPAHEEYPEADDDLDYLGRKGDSTTAAPPPTATLPPLFPPSIASPSSATVSTSTPTIAPEEQNAAALISSMIAQGQFQEGPRGPLQRVYNLPDGAGQLAGVEIKSTAEAKKRAEEAGLVAVTDDKGFLRVGVRINEDLVLLHPKDGKGMPILLKM